MKTESEVINEYISHVNYREQHTSKKDTDEDYVYENGFLYALLWVVGKEDIE